MSVHASRLVYEEPASAANKERDEEKRETSEEGNSRLRAFKRLNMQSKVVMPGRGGTLAASHASLKPSSSRDVEEKAAGETVTIHLIFSKELSDSVHYVAKCNSQLFHLDLTLSASQLLVDPNISILLLQMGTTHSHQYTGDDVCLAFRDHRALRWRQRANTILGCVSFGCCTIAVCTSIP